MASRNADSMTNAQGEFMPRKPRDEPLTTSGHQPGQMVGNDSAPEFHAKTLPPGSAPKSSTYQPNPVNEVSGQANNPDASSQATAALDMPGSTSSDVHTGLGHPGQGQTGSGLRNDGKSHREKEAQGLQGQALGGSGLYGDENREAKNLQKEHVGGVVPAREHNVSLAGAEDKLPVGAEEVAAMGQNPRKGDYDRSADKPPGAHS